MEDSGMLTPSDLGLSRSIPEARIAPGNQMGASIDGTRLELYGSHESLQSTLSLKHSIPTALLTVTDYLKFIPEALGKRSYQNRTWGGGVLNNKLLKYWSPGHASSYPVISVAHKC